MKKGKGGWSKAQEDEDEEESKRVEANLVLHGARIFSIHH